MSYAVGGTDDAGRFISDIYSQGDQYMVYLVKTKNFLGRFDGEEIQMQCLPALMPRVVDTSVLTAKISVLMPGWAKERRRILSQMADAYLLAFECRSNDSLAILNDVLDQLQGAGNDQGQLNYLGANAAGCGLLCAEVS